MERRESKNARHLFVQHRGTIANVDAVSGVMREDAPSSRQT